ncbi:hypothetical protein B0J17DRAFT_669833 [Rhizoctonia solani]|nr:hypothetical protein B0J17DRAFT_669833 [Rhizoctonia solani]
MESDSENEQLLETSNPYGTSEAASRKTQQLLALGAARATAFKRPQISTLPTNGVPALSVNKLAATISTASKSGVTTTNSVVGSARLQKSHSMTSLQQPQRQNKHVRQDAIDAIAGHRSTAVLSILSAATPTLSMTSSLSSMPSQILRRSRRIAARQ